MTARPSVRCLDDELSEYVAGRLDDRRRAAWDLHLVACETCCRAVREERRLREALSGGPAMPGDLRTSLLALGRDLEPPPVPVCPEPLALLAPSAPPCHRSPLRATVVAATAAGLSAAAAWSLTVIGAPAPARPGVTTPVVVPAVATARPVGTAVTTVDFGRSDPTRPTRTVRGAESTP